MSFRGVKAVLLACSGLAAVIAATGTANAGGFALHEQSAYGQGSSYAGVAAGGSLSSMFWNPATMTQVPGIQSESVYSGILPSFVNTATGGLLAGAPFNYGSTGNTAHAAIVPSSYYSWQFNDKLWLGFSVNAPFGLSVTMPDIWAGRDYGAGGTHLATYNFSPTVAYKLNDMISIGIGFQAQYADATFTTGYAQFPTWQTSVDGAGWGYGFTAGITLTPTPTTTIGIGYRSGINQKINGTLSVPPAVAPLSTPGSVSTTLNLPDSVSLGVRQKLSPQWTGMATVEWTNWSRIGTSNVLQPNGAPAVVFAGALVPVAIHFEYKDGWLFALGAEYQWSSQLALRGGFAYEVSPITDTVRIPVLPDNDRFWVSLGATYKITNKLSLDAAYSHGFVKEASINVVPGNPSFNGAITYTGTADSHFDIISVALKYRWDEPPPPAKKVGYFKAK
jgi:long-chain fatty acid transport protein